MTERPVLVPFGPRWLIAHATPFGLQLTVHNFGTLAAAVAFCAQHEAGERPGIEVCGRILAPRDWAILRAIGDAPISNAAAARRAGTSAAASLRSMLALIEMGLAQASGDGVRLYGTTAAGGALVASIDGATTP